MMPGCADQQVLAALLRTDLTAFVHKAFNTVSPGDIYHHNWHIEAITHELRRCRGGENTRLLISQPPRSLKSICSSVAFVAWALGHDPALRFICVSYSQELAAELARQFRLVIDSDWYRGLFPKMRLVKDTGTQCVTSGGGRIATSIGGTITGRGADIIIVDDPLKAEDAASETARTEVIKWYSSTLATRLNDKQRGVIIVVMQRLHEEDLAGHLLEQGGWRHLDLPAIAIEDQRIRIGPASADVHHRKEKSVLHPEREPLATLDRIKADLGSLAFSAQYQQRPVPIEGNLIKREWFHSYDELPTVSPGTRIVQSWDVAGTVTARSDFSVCTTWAICRKDFYLLDAWRGRLEYPDLKRKVIALQREHDAVTVLIEKSDLGLNLVQDLAADSPRGFPNPIRIAPQADKVTRMVAESARIEAGHVVLPRDAPWLGEFLNELMAFPNGRHDDQVDSVSQFLNWAWHHAGRGARVGMVGPEIVTLEDPVIG
jgi:predicted phage terminase large subunit-like protein